MALNYNKEKLEEVAAKLTATLNTAIGPKTPQYILQQRIAELELTLKLKTEEADTYKQFIEGIPKECYMPREESESQGLIGKAWSWFNSDSE